MVAEDGPSAPDPWQAPLHTAGSPAPLAQPAPAPPTSAALRLGVSVVGVALAEALARLEVPGLSEDGADALASAGLTVGVLGLAPILYAFLAVELVAVLSPGGRRLRERGTAGRGRLSRWAWGVALALSATQAAAIALQLELRGADLALAMGGWLVGTGALLLVARWISRLGLGDGVAVLGAWSVLRGALPLLLLQPAAGLGLLLGGAGTALIRRVPSPLALPTCGLLPGYLSVLAATVQLALGSAGVDPSSPSEAGAAVPLRIALAVLTALVLDRLLASPARLRRAGLQVQENLRRHASALSALHAGSLVLVAAVFPAGAGLMGLLAGAYLAGLAMDLLDAVRAHHRAPERVVAWHLARALDVPSALRRLAAAGIPAHATGVHLSALLLGAGPFTCPRVWVAPEAVAPARAILAAPPASELVEGAPGLDVDGEAGEAGEVLPGRRAPALPPDQVQDDLPP
jgi:hypothetical protein